MYKKIFILASIIGYINFASADTSNNSALFTNPNRIKIDQRASAQQRINHLQNRRSKAEMGYQIVFGSICTGAMGALMAAALQDKDTGNHVWQGIATLTAMGMLGGGSIIALGANKEYSEAEAQEIAELQKFIIEAEKK